MDRVKLTPKQHEVLLRLRDDPEADLVYEKNHGWWCGFDRLGAGVAWALIRLSFVSLRSRSGELVQRYEINGTGIRHLQGLKPYTDSRGRHFWTFRELLAAKSRTKGK